MEILVEMKHLFSSIMLLAIILTSSAQELILPQKSNKDSTLSYTYAITSKNNAASIASKIDAILSKKGAAISYTRNGEFADVAFNFVGDNKIAFSGKTLEFKSENEVAGLCSDALLKMFYSGMPPTYSTLFTGYTGGYAEYRIPSVVSLPTGRIVAFIEARAVHSDQAQNKIIAKYSDNYGKSWSAPIVVADNGQASLNNPCVVYLESKNQILLIYQYFPPKSTEGSTKAGLVGDDVVRIYSITSGDGGESWSAPSDITAQIKHPEVSSVCCGPGAAIVVKYGPYKGRIIVPCNGNGAARWFNYIAYSDDCAGSWKIARGESAYGTNESQVVQIDDTTALVNARSHRNIGDSTSHYAPDGWNPWNFSKVTRNRANMTFVIKGDSVAWAMPQIMANQPDPTCQGSIIKVGDMLLLSNPASQHTAPVKGRPYAQTPPLRINGTVRVSDDNGKTWSHSKRIYGNRFTEFQYSVLIDLGDGKIGCLFEAHPDVKFALFDIAWLTQEQ